MDMVDNDDILLKDFLQANKQEVADNGFSRRVMNRLPERKAQLLSYLLSAVSIVLAVVLFFVQGGVGLVGSALREVFQNISFSGNFSSLNGTEPWTVAVVAVVLLFMGYGKLANLPE
ncbi:MAG: DUF5056 domain-containing protein [Bacteroidaceae bacterium]|nr:DUF5056 domain-containing protein [Bacteroidaceae bacterium]